MPWSTHRQVLCTGVSSVAPRRPEESGLPQPVSAHLTADDLAQPRPLAGPHRGGCWRRGGVPGSHPARLRVSPGPRHVLSTACWMPWGQPCLTLLQCALRWYLKQGWQVLGNDVPPSKNQGRCWVLRTLLMVPQMSPPRHQRWETDSVNHPGPRACVYHHQ